MRISDWSSDVCSSDLNMPAAAMRASGLDYETLSAVKPDIILASATAYGEGGPYSDRIGFDGTGQVLSGAVYRQGLPDQPIRTAVPYVDYGTALTMAMGVMMALSHRQATGPDRTGVAWGKWGSVRVDLGCPR